MIARRQLPVKQNPQSFLHCRKIAENCIKTQKRCNFNLQTGCGFTPSVLPLRGNPPSPRGRLMAMPESFRFYERRPLEGQLPPAGGRCRAATKGGIWLCEAKTEGVTIRSHSAPASCRGGSADRSTASGTPSPDTYPSRCSAAHRRSTARPDSRSLPGTPTWTRCSRSW